MGIGLVQVDASYGELNQSGIQAAWTTSSLFLNADALMHLVEEGNRPLELLSSHQLGDSLFLCS